MSRRGVTGEPLERVGEEAKAADTNAREVNAFLRLTGRLKEGANDGILPGNDKIAPISLCNTPIYESDKWKNLRSQTRTTKAFLSSPIYVLPTPLLASRWDPRKDNVLSFGYACIAVVYVERDYTSDVNAVIDGNNEAMETVCVAGSWVLQYYLFK
ncbi:hypothetical protein B296_00006925 [Ensete ventricosum]|uniref:Uncharacterized protein n=1 Tax=Ensete ventricosum TaxID=4639 RepID=A0A427B3E1_ENSVE|nr:hypothetical protein B296_00006925 [Ensete ventricosum]